MGDSGAGGEVVESGTGDVEHDSFDERLSILTPDAVSRAGHALTDRNAAGSVLSSARRGWSEEQIGRPQMKAPGRQEYGKLSYAGAGSYMQIDALPALCTT
jgi:hypothetical protein